MAKRSYLPFVLPLLVFVMTILIGTVLLHETSADGKLSWIDAMFTATSALCVTGLGVVSWETGFSREGHWIILCLMQLGGLGVMTYSTLAFYLWRKKVSLTDRLAVGAALLHDNTFHLGMFLQRLLVIVLGLETVGAVLLYVLGNGRFSPFTAVFHAVSAFCNAGISLFPDSLMQFRTDTGITCIFMGLILAGALGFSVLDEGFLWLRGYRRKRMRYSVRIVLETSFWLVLGGAVALYGVNLIVVASGEEISTSFLTSLFFSVSARTTGFSTIRLEEMTNMSLLILLFLMFVGGAPGSCAGGIKVTTFRGFLAFLAAQFRGREQVVMNGRALGQKTIHKVLMLVSGSVLLIFLATFALTLTEGKNLSQFEVRGQLVEIFFEVVSAFTTVGLSVGFTAKLTTAGKGIIMFIMFVGRVGPVWVLTAMHNIRSDVRYQVPEVDLPVG
ncbi:TrkH family potassium uptake protein [Halodesulfovibrio spirochaetisodalis]|uniref:Potassium transporter TrkH n=1 Tax=Halodesulfovibrio spirochaetisodalis TaxID=1560234 RepID=A0A1B7XE29_9BACT|nr:potassium transporter TrkG [Halodesulfovibrio spirochaetisodalis]OBQ52410.1 potassium transporter TrkH [Halodesulfovibrio spirochaetisodalis]